MLAKTETLGPDLQVCMGPTTHVWIFAHITACLAQEYQVYMGSSHHLWFCACKTATLGPELHVYMGCSPHLWFMHAKRRLEDKNYKSAWFPDLICGFVQTKQLA